MQALQAKVTVVEVALPTVCRPVLVVVVLGLLAEAFLHPATLQTDSLAVVAPVRPPALQVPQSLMLVVEVAAHQLQDLVAVVAWVAQEAGGLAPVTGLHR